MMKISMLCYFFIFLHLITCCLCEVYVGVDGDSLKIIANRLADNPFTEQPSIANQNMRDESLIMPVYSYGFILPEIGDAAKDDDSTEFLEAPYQYGEEKSHFIGPFDSVLELNNRLFRKKSSNKIANMESKKSVQNTSSRDNEQLAKIDQKPFKNMWGKLIKILSFEHLTKSRSTDKSLIKGTSTNKGDSSSTTKFSSIVLNDYSNKFGETFPKENEQVFDNSELEEFESVLQKLIGKHIPTIQDSAASTSTLGAATKEVSTQKVPSNSFNDYTKPFRPIGETTSKETKHVSASVDLEKFESMRKELTGKTSTNQNLATSRSTLGTVTEEVTTNEAHTSSKPRISSNSFNNYTKKMTSKGETATKETNRVDPKELESMWKKLIEEMSTIKDFAQTGSTQMPLPTENSINEAHSSSVSNSLSKSLDNSKTTTAKEVTVPMTEKSTFANSKPNISDYKELLNDVYKIMISKYQELSTYIPISSTEEISKDSFTHYMASGSVTLTTVSVTEYATVTKISFDGYSTTMHPTKKG